MGRLVAKLTRGSGLSLFLGEMLLVAFRAAVEQEGAPKNILL